MQQTHLLLKGGWRAIYTCFKSIKDPKMNILNYGLKHPEVGLIFQKVIAQSVLNQNGS